MVLYMHVILFFICLNLGLGFTAIPNTPLHIDNAQENVLNNCFTLSQENLIVYDSSTSTWIKNQNTNSTLNSGTQDMAALEGYIDDFGGSYDPITDAISASYETIDLLKGILLGGFITNAIDNVTLHCDFSSSNTTGSVVVDDPIMQYFKVALNIIFGLMLFLAILYLVTGKGFGL
jgi:hypothetical protein